MSNREEKKNQFAESEKKSRKPIVVVIGVAVIGVVLAVVFGLNPSVTSASNVVTAKSGKVSIPVADVSDGKAHYYTYEVDGKPVSFFLLKSKDGQIRAALNACDVCYKSLKGYRQEGDFMVCNNCNQQFESNRINVVKGGCNPAPLTREVVNGQVVLLEHELKAGLAYFPAS